MEIDGEEHESKLTDEDIDAKLKESRAKLWEGGCHYVIDTIRELPSVMAKINAMLANGEKPWIQLENQYT